MSKSSYRRARTLNESIQNALDDHLRFKARSVHDEHTRLHSINLFARCEYDEE